MSSYDLTTSRWSTADTVAGFLATISILASTLGLVYRPARIVPFAILIALIAARMSARNQALAGWAIAIGCVWWTLGMTIAVVAEKPLW
jgi:hypothetical protein